jgi:hypothetical protein
LGNDDKAPSIGTRGRVARIRSDVQNASGREAAAFRGFRVADSRERIRGCGQTRRAARRRPFWFELPEELYLMNT